MQCTTNAEVGVVAYLTQLLDKDLSSIITGFSSFLLSRADPNPKVLKHKSSIKTLRKSLGRTKTTLDNTLHVPSRNPTNQPQIPFSCQNAEPLSRSNSTLRFPSRGFSMLTPILATCSGHQTAGRGPGDLVLVQSCGFFFRVLVVGSEAFRFFVLVC